MAASLIGAGGLTKPQELDHPILEQYQRHLFYHARPMVIHTATHPGRLAKVGQHMMEDTEPSAGDVLMALDLEAEEEADG
jgi:hypothetical protein